VVQTDLREVSKRFFVLYYPVLLIIMITNITLTHHIGFNPLGVSLAKKIFEERLGGTLWFKRQAFISEK
jgi:hypothetical protein